MPTDEIFRVLAVAEYPQCRVLKGLKNTGGIHNNTNTASTLYSQVPGAHLLYNPDNTSIIPKAR